jgi:hypothetical protein
MEGNMQLGDIDGIGKIYDKSGDAILKKNETLIEEFKGKCKSWGAKSKRGFEVIKGFSCEGKFIVTNKRILFLGEPQHYHAGFDVFGVPPHSVSITSDFPTVGRIQYVYRRSTITKEKNGKLYMNIPLKDIKEIKVGTKKSEIIIKISSRKTFRFIIENNAGKIIKTAIGKMNEL